MFNRFGRIVYVVSRVVHTLGKIELPKPVQSDHPTAFCYPGSCQLVSIPGFFDQASFALQLMQAPPKAFAVKWTLGNQFSDINLHIKLLPRFPQTVKGLEYIFQ
jgi:hypothetical protein